MGVMTKPDLLTTARHPHIGRILKREIFKLSKGWFVAKSLSQIELEQKVTHTQAREREQTFFANNEPWSSSLAGFTRRFGVPRLQEAISHELTQHILNEYVPFFAQILLADLLAAFQRLCRVSKREWPK